MVKLTFAAVLAYAPLALTPGAVMANTNNYNVFRIVANPPYQAAVKVADSDDQGRGHDNDQGHGHDNDQGHGHDK